MNAYERMLEVMRKQGKKDNPASIEIAYVSDGQSIMDRNWTKMII